MPSRISALLLLLFLCPLLCAEPPRRSVQVAKAQAQALLLLAHCPHAQPVQDACPCFEDLGEAQAEAQATGKPLLVWVGGCDCELRQGFCDCVNCSCAEYNGDSSPRLILPTGQGWAWYWDNPAVRNGPEIRHTLRLFQPRRFVRVAQCAGGS